MTQIQLSLLRIQKTSQEATVLNRYNVAAINGKAGPTVQRWARVSKMPSRPACPRSSILPSRSYKEIFCAPAFQVLLHVPISRSSADNFFAFLKLMIVPKK